MKPKVNSGHLAPDLLAQSGAGRQVLGCGQSGEDNGLVGEIAVFTLSFDSLKSSTYLRLHKPTRMEG
jgi:hypothetical protein